jgi:threonine dehydrogenase-like Zn-dependent dehydrogenase
VHIVKGEYPVKQGLILGHEPVGVIDELGSGLDEDYTVGQRVIVGAITPCGQCFYCLNGVHSQCHGPLGGWRFGNTINGAWAEYLLVPDARANLALIPDGLTDEQVLMLPDIASTGISGAESGGVRTGDAVAVFAQGPIGLCATLGARLRGASLIVGVDPTPERRAMSTRFGASVTINPNACNVVEELKRLTEGRGVDVAIEALGRQETFEAAAFSATGRRVVQSRCLLRQAGRAVRSDLRRARGSADRDDTLSRRQGADATAVGDGGHRARRSDTTRHASLRPR